MHIGLDARLTYYTGGGISQYIRQLASRLPGLDPENRYTVFHRRGQAETLSPDGTRADLFTPAHHPLERLTLSMELGLRGLDLLHSPDFIPPYYGGRRSLITVHDLTFIHYPEFLTPGSRRYYKSQIHSAVRRADHISADSYFTRDDLIRLLDVPSEKITVIHLACNADFRRMPEEQVGPVLARLGLAPGYILFVGTFEPRKNIPGLLRAYTRLRKIWQGAPPLVLAGRRGWLFEPVRALIDEPGLERHVRLLEELSGADLPALYNGASAFILPSHYEGFGIPLLEAMACGIPSLVANRASLPELAGEAALLLDPDDPDQMADQLHRALTDEALQQALRSRGLERVKQFGWEETAQKTVGLYKKVMEAR